MTKSARFRLWRANLESIFSITQTSSDSTTPVVSRTCANACSAKRCDSPELSTSKSSASPRPVLWTTLGATISPTDNCVFSREVAEGLGYRLSGSTTAAPIRRTRGTGRNRPRLRPSGVRRKVSAFGVFNHTPRQIDLLKTAVTQPILASQIRLSVTHSTIVA